MLFLKNTVLFLFIIISLVSKSQTRIDTVYSAYQNRIETVTFTNKNQKTVYQYSFSTPQFIQSETKFLNGKKHGKFIQYSEKNITKMGGFGVNNLFTKMERLLVKKLLKMIPSMVNQYHTTQVE